MLAIAREMNLSETYLCKSPRPRKRSRDCESHNKRRTQARGIVIGTWFLLAELGVVPAQDGGVHVLQETGAGVLPVEIRI